MYNIYIVYIALEQDKFEFMKILFISSSVINAGKQSCCSITRPISFNANSLSPGLGFIQFLEQFKGDNNNYINISDNISL